MGDTAERDNWYSWGIIVSVTRLGHEISRNPIIAHNTMEARFAPIWSS
jgi:hypothetical protein